MSRLVHSRRRVTTLGVLGAALVPGQLAGLGLAPAEAAGAPLAECHDLTMTFTNVTYRSYDIVVRAVVTQPGTFRLGDGHGFFGTSETVPDPAGVLMESTATILGDAPGTDVEWTASCIGGSVTEVVHVPAAPVPPTVRVRGPLTVVADDHRGVPDPLAASAVDAAGRTIAAHCTPALLPIVPSRTTVTCTAKDSSGRVGRTTRVVTVLGAAAQLDALRRSLGPSHLRDLVDLAHDAVVLRDGPAASRRLGLVLDHLPYSGLGATRAAAVTADVRRVARVLGREVSAVHQVRPGESVWSIVHDALLRRTGTAPSGTAVAAGVRLVLAANPGALDRYGHLHPGAVLRVQL